MADPTLDDLGPLQRQVLDLLWQTGEGTVYDILDRLPDPKPPYTSVLSALQKLEKVGWASARREGRQYVYAAAKSREELDDLTLRAFVDRVFRGQTARMFQHLLADPNLSAKELAELKRLKDGIEADEIDRVKAGLKSSLIMQEESTSARAGAIATDWYYLGRVRPVEEIQAIIDGLTPAKILSYLDRCPVRDVTLVTLGPAPLTIPA